MESAMQLDAAMCDTLVAIVKEKTGAKDSRARPLNKAMTNVVGQLRADSLERVTGEPGAVRARDTAFRAVVCEHPIDC